MAKWLGLAKLKQEAKIFIQVSHVGSGAQGLVPSVAAFPGASAGSWIRGRATRLEIAPMREGIVTGDGLTSYTTMLTQVITSLKYR